VREVGFRSPGTIKLAPETAEPAWPTKPLCRSSSVFRVHARGGMLARMNILAAPIDHAIPFPCAVRSCCGARRYRRGGVQPASDCGGGQMGWCRTICVGCGTVIRRRGPLPCAPVSLGGAL